MQGLQPDLDAGRLELPRILVGKPSPKGGLGRTPPRTYAAAGPAPSGRCGRNPGSIGRNRDGSGGKVGGSGRNPGGCGRNPGQGDHGEVQRTGLLARTGAERECRGRGSTRLPTVLHGRLPRSDSPRSLLGG